MGSMTTAPAARNPRHGRRRRVTAAVSGVLVLAAAGCSNPTTPQASTAESSPTSVEDSPTATAPSTATDTPAAAGCRGVSYPLAYIPKRTVTDPTMMIPRPPGWDIVEFEGMESRFALANRALSNANEFTPRAIVNLDAREPEPGVDWPPKAQAMFDEARSAMLDLRAEFQSSTPTTVCGQQAEISEYTQPAEGLSAPVVTKLLMLVAESENVTYLAQLRVSTTEPDNPTYQRDSQAMLDGFVYLPSAR